MEYFLGAVAGIVYGGLVGFLKYFFLWRKLLKEENNAVNMKVVTVKMIISYAINFVTLILTYFLRNIIPFDFVAFAVGTAMALSLAGKIFSMQKILQKTEM